MPSFTRLHTVSSIPDKNNQSIFVNLENIAQLHRWPGEAATYIIFVGNPSGCLKVLETPAQILQSPIVGGG